MSTATETKPQSSTLSPTLAYPGAHPVRAC